MMHSRIIVAVKAVILSIGLFIPLGLQARNLPARPSPPRLVNDLAHVLSADESELLEAKLESFNDSTSNQIAVVTIPTIGEDEINAYATDLYNTWGIGTSKNNNGVLLLAVMQDHKLYISVGRGLQGALPDITAKHIVDQEITPRFRDQNYYGGLNSGINAIMAATRGEYKGTGPRQQRESRGVGTGGVIAIIFIIYFILWILRRGGGGGGSFMSRRGYGGFGGGFLTGSILGSMLGGGRGGGWGGGGGGWGDSGGGGGFGGFGGGSTDGGGAGGSW